MSCRSCPSEDGHRRGCPDQPGCRWCGRDVERDDTLCGGCSEERHQAQAEEAFAARHEVLLSERRWAAPELVGSGE